MSVRIAVPLLAALPLAAQTPTPWTIWRLPDTGQTRRYATAPGDDAAFSINPPRFASGAAGLVTDLVTGLQWQQTDGGEMRWDAAVRFCRDLALDGGGWRLPYAQELFTIQNHGQINPALDTAVFTRTAAEYWWAVENRADSAALAWATNAGGGIGAHPLTETVSAGGAKRFHARCVRSVATGNGVAEPYTDHGNGTVTDNRTGLMWQKAEGAAALTWEDALGYAGTLRLGGYADWRVPNIKELRSLHSDAVVRPSINAAYFPGTASAPFWSSTTQIGQNGVTAWTLDFTNGVVSYNPKTDRLRLRAVRAGGGPRIAFGGIRNAASFAETALSPGEMISIFGSELGFPEGRGASIAGGRLTSAVEGRRVLINGIPAPVVSWYDGQVNVVTPNAVAPGANVTVAIEVDGATSPALVLAAGAASPGVFTANASGAGPAAAFNQDGALNTPATPAARGSILVLYATGHGILQPPLPDGALLSGPSPQLTLPLEVRLGGAACDVLYAGLVPGLPSGLLQLNIRVPASVEPGSAVPVEIRLGEFRSQAAVTVAVR